MLEAVNSETVFSKRMRSHTATKIGNPTSRINIPTAVSHSTHTYYDFPNAFRSATPMGWIRLKF